MDRSGLPLPEQVSRLRNEFDQLKGQVNDLPTEARVTNMDWEDACIMSILGAVLISGLVGFTIHTCSAKDIEEARISAQRASDQEHTAVERLAQNRASAEYNAQVEAETRERDTQTCTRACTLTHMEMIRPSPCMCGGGGQLLLFSEDYSYLSRVREGENLEVPPSEIPESTEEE